jgi:hypothetical protein
MSGPPGRLDHGPIRLNARLTHAPEGGLQCVWRLDHFTYLEVISGPRELSGRAWFAGLVRRRQLVQFSKPALDDDARRRTLSRGHVVPRDAFCFFPSFLDGLMS